MEVVICSDDAEVGAVAADRVISALEGNQTPVLGVATGSSPIRLYEELARRAQAGEVDFSHGLAFALDEYVGIPPEHELSYKETIRRTVQVPLGMDPARVRVPNGFAVDLAAAAREYDDAIAGAGGVDVQILGIGTNGHIGFNEPTSSFSSRTRVKTLTRQTREDNARFFAEGETVPTHCVTQGLGTIMEARTIVMVASGAHKADAVAAMVEGPVAAVCPASILQFHPKVLVVVDEAAGARLRYAEYFRGAAAVPSNGKGESDGPLSNVSAG
ncbi:glucosamine-6-phosphate deaminase [Tessaracoccus sp. OS52]|uniref:glucosamine-6-phosphate deaminase n=1 Tax=Tessaracoccus sp. OS52 TaxID=2886691 RepID=UPI001D0F793B|nr:glucosamine-6-phosphate deaminase [Tessaracoccus sp. OS52]MCC2592009.1 glucosamine-6-phosphate deaminase [Tessaracoccus sp. OS52]